MKQILRIFRSNEQLRQWMRAQHQAAYARINSDKRTVEYVGYGPDDPKPRSLTHCRLEKEVRFSLLSDVRCTAFELAEGVEENLHWEQLEILQAVTR